MVNNFNYTFLVCNFVKIKVFKKQNSYCSWNKKKKNSIIFFQRPPCPQLKKKIRKEVKEKEGDLKEKCVTLAFYLGKCEN